MRSFRAWVAVGVALAATGCDRGVRQDAARQVQAFLTAASTGDQAAFEAALDREALRTDLKAQLLTLPEIRALQSQLGEEVGDVAADRMISTEAVMRAHSGLGPAPSLKQVSAALKVLDAKHVCLPDAEDADRCVMTFEKQSPTWKLTALQATDLRAQIPEDW